MLRRWIKYAETIKRRTKHDSSDGLYTSLMASTYKTSRCTKLSQKKLLTLTWSYFKLNIQRKIIHLAQTKPRKFDLGKHEIVRYNEKAELQKMKVIWR